MRSRTAASSGSTKSGSASNTSSSCTCISIAARVPCPASHASTVTIARLMMSAAVPCIGALIAARSAPARCAWLREAISARGRRLLPSAIHVVAHARIAREVQRDVVLRIAAADAKLLDQAERAHAVHQAEIDRLRRAALLARDGVRCQAEHLGRRGAMHVLATAE